MSEKLSPPDEISFVLDGPPVGWQRVASRRGQVKKFVPRKTRNYKDYVTILARQAMAHRPLMRGGVAVKVLVSIVPPASFTKAKREQAVLGHIHPTVKPDTDNVQKALFDAMNQIVYEDDKQIVDVIYRKRYGTLSQVHVSVSAVSVSSEIPVDTPPLAVPTSPS